MELQTKPHPAVENPKNIKNTISGINGKIVILSATLLGSVWFFYFCLLLDLVELGPVLRSRDTIVVITYLAQTVIQLVALPLLQNYQNRITAYNNTKADVDHKALTHIANVVDQIGDTLGIEKPRLMDSPTSAELMLDEPDF